MAGGTFTQQNKIRPGAYINFVSVPRPMISIGARGITIAPMELDWGAEDEIIEVLSTDLSRGNSLNKIGLTLFDDKAFGLSLMLSKSHTALIYRMNAGGIKAIASFENLIFTAKYSGELGNSIVISVTENAARFIVRTFVGNRQVDSQTIDEISELKDNDFVTVAIIDEPEERSELTKFSKFSANNEKKTSPLSNNVKKVNKEKLNPALNKLTEISALYLQGGTNGTVADGDIDKFLNKAEGERWNTMAIIPFLQNPAIEKSNIINFLINQRNEEGRYVQGVGFNVYSDNETIINVVQTLEFNDRVATESDMVMLIAGATANATVTQDLTADIVVGATSIINSFSNTEIEDNLQNGQFLFSYNQNGTIKVENDINTLTTFTQDKNREFSSNGVMRILDEIGTTTRDIWETVYMGKMPNNDIGRGLFKGDLAEYFLMLQDIGAIQNFEISTDLEVIGGAMLDDVVVNVWIQPVMVAKKLYMTVNVRG